MTGPSKPLSATASIRCSAASTTRGATRSIRDARSFGRSCSLHGSATAPMRKQATMASTHSGVLPITVITTSPRPAPCRARVDASRAERSATSPNGISRRFPSPSRATRAGRSRGAESTTSRAKFIRPILCPWLARVMRQSAGRFAAGTRARITSDFRL